MLSEGKSKWWWNTTLLFCRYVPFGTWGFVQSQTKAILWSSPGKFSQEGFSQPELPAKLSSPPQLDQVSLTDHFTSKFTSFATSPMFIPSFQASPLCCEPHYQVCALESPFAVLEIWKSNNWKNLMEEFVKVIFVPFTCYKIDPDEHSASSTSWSPTSPWWWWWWWWWLPTVTWWTSSTPFQMPRGEKLKLQNFPTPGNNGKFENNDDDNNQGDDDDDDNDDQNDNLSSSSGFAPPPPWSRPLTPRYQSCFLTWYQDRWWYHLNYHGRAGWSLVMVIFTLHADQSYSSFTFYDLTLTLWLPSHYRDPFFVT